MNKWEKAYIHKDTSLLAEVLHDKYLYAGNADGSRTTKEQVINELYSSDYQILKVVFEELDIQCFGSTAIVRGNELIYLLLASGDTLQVPLSFTDVYQKNNGMTRALATHSSPRQ
ncbi:nuclear transport factor 2 family protein [Marinoscillum furvescens]|nr:nuclear transport factor 2 family protein [Marinoscillum furvescens]